MGRKLAKLVRITTNNQVAIPAFIVRDLNLSKGAYLEVEKKGRQIIMTPKRVVDEEDFAMYEEAGINKEKILARNKKWQLENRQQAYKYQRRRALLRARLLFLFRSRLLLNAFQPRR